MFTRLLLIIKRVQRFFLALFLCGVSIAHTSFDRETYFEGENTENAKK